MNGYERQFYIFFKYSTAIMIRLLLTVIFFTLIFSCRSQTTETIFPLTKQDTLRGSITKERAWWDVIKYDITVQPSFESKTIEGVNVITFKAVDTGRTMQIDLQEPMQIDEVTYKSNRLPLRRNGNVFYVNFPHTLKKEDTGSVKITFSGKPREAKNPPWDGGWIWRKDSYGNPWMSVACQGLGASVWYPCKDHQSDEPESATLTIITPDTLIGVGNGRLVSSRKAAAGFQSYTWSVTNPINNYNIVPYIGRYVNWTDTFNGENGNLDIS
jgi:aminopeptidase N